MILRMCNDLLKRISRTVDTSFCGRILILLAKSLPLNEKSGLNLPGQFNVANSTSYEQEKVEKIEEPDDDNEMEIGEIRENKDSLNFDYGLYTKFWEIQSFFSNPNSVYDSASFDKFENILSEVLNLFSTYKLERPGSKPLQKERSSSTAESIIPARNGILNGNCKAKLEIKMEDMSFSQDQNDQKPSCSTNAIKEDNFFAKYLTNQKLFNLQLADSQFRRYFLVQCLILTNYLLSKTKLKENFNSLSQSQENFIKEVAEKGHGLLKETYPLGTHFADSVRRILSREKVWSSWKGEGCPDLVAPLLKQETKAFKQRPVKRYDPSAIDLGNSELTRLWNIAPDNLAACMDERRNCVPDLKQFLVDGLDEMDPEQKVEEQYRSVNDEKYQWMASRFLLYNSEQYMNCVNIDPKAPRQTTAKFLEKAVQMTALFTPELKSKAETIQAAVVRKKEDEEAEKKKLAEEQEAKLKEQEAEAAQEQMRKELEEVQKKKKLEEEQKRKALEEEKKRLKAQEEEQKHRNAEEEQKRRQLIESVERKKQEAQNKKLAAAEEKEAGKSNNKVVKEEPKQRKVVVEESAASSSSKSQRRIKIHDEKTPPHQRGSSKDKEKEKERESREKHHDQEKQVSPLPSPALPNKSSSKSKRVSNADSSATVVNNTPVRNSKERDDSPAVPAKKPREDNTISTSHKKEGSRSSRQPATATQSTPLTANFTTSHGSSRRSNGQETKHSSGGSSSSSRNDKKKT